MSHSNRGSSPIPPAWLRPPQESCAALLEHQQLAAAWDRSASTLEALHRAISESPPPHVRCVFASGSLARMQQHSHSDCDLVVVVDEQTPAEVAQTAVAGVYDRINQVPITSPQPGGIYAQPAFPHEFGSRAAQGQVDESLRSYGQRMQLLLESQPIYGEEVYRQLVLDAIRRFLTRPSAMPTQWPFEPTHGLAHEAVRYYHSLWVRSHWIAERRRWELINRKLRISRLLAFAGMLAWLGHSIDQANSNHQLALAPGVSGQTIWLAQHITLTSLERLSLGITATGQSSWQQILQTNAQLLAWLENQSETQADERALGDVSESLRELFWSARNTWGSVAIESMLFG